MKSFPYCYLLLALFLLHGCASRPPKVEVPEGWKIQKQQLENLHDWQLRGKLAYKNAEDKFSATILWVQAPEASQLKLLNPLGVTLVTIQVSSQGAALEADGKTYQDSNINDLLYQTTGWDIPVGPMRNWIKGLPDDEDIVQFNDNGTLKRLYPQCEGCTRWQIDYDDFTELQGLVLPRSLTVVDTTKTNAFIKIRVSSWR